MIKIIFSLYLTLGDINKPTVGWMCRKNNKVHCGCGSAIVDFENSCCLSHDLPPSEFGVGGAGGRSGAAVLAVALGSARFLEHSMLVALSNAQQATTERHSIELCNKFLELLASVPPTCELRLWLPRHTELHRGMGNLDWWASLDVKHTSAPIQLRPKLFCEFVMPPRGQAGMRYGGPWSPEELPTKYQRQPSKSYGVRSTGSTVLHHASHLKGFSPSPAE